MEHYQASAEQVLKRLETSLQGLSEKEASLRLEKHGKNEILKAKPTPLLKIFLSQFTNFLVLILILAAMVSFFFEKGFDAAIILAIVVLNGLFGFLQEYKAEQEIQALMRMTAPKAVVVRDGKQTRVDAADVVPGDLVVLEAGDRVPADARIVASESLRTDESLLTGESLPTEKTVESAGKMLQIADQNNMVFAGTNVAYGHGLAVVTETGMRTEVGKIAAMIQTTEYKTTPMQKKLRSFGIWIGIIVLVISGVISVLGIMQGKPTLEMFLTGVSLAVAAIPEGLPAIITLTLALGMQQMSRKNAIIRKLPAVETLGSTTVICSDKTGTLTKNQMTVRELFTNQTITVTGSGYEPRGAFSKKLDENARLLLRCGVLCNTAHVEKNKAIGDPTEAALVVAAQKAGVADERKKLTKLWELPFDSDRKMMSVAYKTPAPVMFSKGAPESILKNSSHYFENGVEKKIDSRFRQKVLEKNREMASRALRVLAFAYKPASAAKPAEERGLVFIGLAGMIDPPRPEVKKALETCCMAGIRVIMITGDNKETAAAVARELGMAAENILSGHDLEGMNEKQLAEAVKKTTVFARTTPEHKFRIVAALKKQGHVVAVTGDGVNDAPALKNADIGVAVGSGTDVAKEASDMVIADDNFATIVSAVSLGRTIYDNTVEFIRYLLACNAGEVLTMFVGIMLLPFAPLFPIQILWMNLVTDGLPAIALGIDPAEKDVMQRPPRKRTSQPVNKQTFAQIIVLGAIMCIGALFMFSSELADPEKAVTMAFTTLIMFQLFFALTCRSSKPIIKAGLFDNKLLWLAVLTSAALQVAVVQLPQLQPIFHTVALDVGDWIEIIAVALVGFLVIESLKFFSVFKPPVLRRRKASVCQPAVNAFA